jgi:hypothetical protein
MAADILETSARSAVRNPTSPAHPAYADSRQCLGNTWDMPSLVLAMNLC